MHIENIVEILWPILFGIIFGSILWKQIVFPIIRSQGTESQCLSLSPEAKFPNFEGAFWYCAIKIEM